MDPNANCVTLQKNVTLYYMDGVTATGNSPSYFGYPSLPNAKSAYRLYGNFWNFKYFFEAQSISGTRIDTDACQMLLSLTTNSDSSDAEIQLYCDSGPKANFGGWQFTKMKWISVKVAFINPDTKQVLSPKKTEGETRCGKLLCQCGQTKLCHRKQNFCSSDYLQPLFVINKCVKPKNGMGASFYCTVDAVVTVTLFQNNPNTVPASCGNAHDIYLKSQQEASKRIFHAKIGTDLKLEVNGKEFPCHKCILAGHSEVFSRMFSIDNNKRQGCQFPTKLVMENMSVVGVDSFLKYLYYGDTTFSELPASVAFELMRAGAKYSIPHLRRTSYEILYAKPLDDFDCGTTLKMYLLSSSSIPTSYSANYASLKSIALQFFTKYYVELVKSEDFVKLFEDNREVAQEILIKIHRTK